MILNKEKNKAKIAFTIGAINIITLPIVWALFAVIGDYAVYILIAEVFALMAEATVYRFALKKVFEKYRYAVLFSLVLNAISFVLGIFVFAFLVHVI